MRRWVAAWLVIAVVSAVSARVQADSVATDPERAAELLRLKQERAEVSLYGPIGLSATGLGLVVGGSVFGLYATVFSFSVCEDTDYEPDCFEPGMVRGFAITGATLGVAGGVLLAVGIPWLRRTLRKRRELGQRIRKLTVRDVDLSVQPERIGASLTFAF